jgi:hypothetical protein
MSRRVFMQGTTVLCTLPDETEAIGRFVDGRGNKTCLYLGGAGCWLHRQDRDDPSVETEVRSIGLDDAAKWLVGHGCAVPPDLQKCLRGGVDFDQNGKAVAFGPRAKRRRPENDALSYASLREFAERHLKKKQRRIVELVCDGDGQCPIADLAIDIAIEWSAPYDDACQQAIRRINGTLAKHSQPWKLRRHDNSVRAEKMA